MQNNLRVLFISLFVCLFLFSSNAQAQVEPLIETQWRNYTWPYNALYPESEDGINGHLGNACGPTSMAHLLRYWMFPARGFGEVDFTDNNGTHWSANFGETDYNHHAMPLYISPSAPPEVYTPAAELVYHAAVSMEDYWGSGRDTEALAEAFVNYFGYSSDYEVVNRWEHSRDEWKTLAMNELDAGRPILVAGRTPDSPPPWEPGNYAGHYYLCDGYAVDEDTTFHLVYGYGNFDYYYDIDEMGDHSAYTIFLLNLHPELNGKLITVTAPNGGEAWEVGSEVQVTWTSEAVDAVDILYSVDGGWNWLTAAEDIEANQGGWSWTVPEAFSQECLIKVVDASDVNVRDWSDDTFEIYNQRSLELTSVLDDRYFQSGAEIPLRWTYEGVQHIDIEITTNGGGFWVPVAENLDAATGVYSWTVPGVETSEGYLRIVDADDGEVTSSHEAPFSIGEEEVVGGPYAVDEHTVLLLSFDGDFSNKGLTGDAQAHNGVTTGTDGELTLDHCVRILNDAETVGSCLVVPDAPELDLTGDWTIEAWVKVASIGPPHAVYPQLIVKPGADEFYNHAYGITSGEELPITASYHDGGANLYPVFAPNGTLPLDEWVHIAYIRDTDAGETRLLLHDLDHQLIAEYTGPANGTPVTNGEDLHIGGFGMNSNVQFDGWMDEIRISNVVREFGVIDSLPESRQSLMPEEFALLHVYPNPFNDSARIFFRVERGGQVSLAVFDILGRRVATLADNRYAPGVHALNFEASNLSSGTYFLRLSGPSGDLTKSIQLLR